MSSNSAGLYISDLWAAPGLTALDAPRFGQEADLLSDEEARALVSVVTGIAEDLGVDCAVAVLDSRGDVHVAVRSGQLSGDALASAIACARAAVVKPEAIVTRAGAAGVALSSAGGLRGGLGVSGGPEGFGLEACRHARQALGLV
jgi:uncharacterized protein GlcG (DUF336 family)